MFLGLLQKDLNLVTRVFVPYCACWLDDRWSRGTKTLDTRVKRICFKEGEVREKIMANKIIVTLSLVTQGLTSSFICLPVALCRK